MTNDTAFPNILRGRIWHTTHPDRYQEIMESGFILPNPPLPDNERCNTANGPINYPYVRILDGVSLFDFDDFDSERYAEKFPLSTWSSFIPYSRQWRISVWIEIDRRKIVDHFMSANDLFARWEEEKAHGHNIMPLIEAAHLGPISKDIFLGIYISSAACPKFQFYQI